MNNKEVFLMANSALAEGNYDEFITYCADDIKWENVGKSTFNGKAELLGYISSAYDGITFITEGSIEENDTIVELGQLVIAQDGQSREASYCDVWRFENGKISQLTSFVIEKS